MKNTLTSYTNHLKDGKYMYLHKINDTIKHHLDDK